jgi:hypothetical protein
MNLRISSIFLGFIMLSLPLRAQPKAPLKYDEVFSVIKTNLSDIPESELQSLSARGLLEELGSKVELVTTNEPSVENVDEPITRKTIYNESYAYLRISRMQSNTPEHFDKDLKELGLNKTLKGIVIDLRYAGGQDYDAAAQLADRFTPGGALIAKIEGREIRSTDKKETIKLPLAVLVNGETKGACEAFAAFVRNQGVALIIGQKTAGEARVFQTFTLSTGQKLKIGTIPIDLPDGKSIPSKGLVPDLKVTVSPEAEEALYKDPYLRLDLAFASTNGTNTVGTNALARAERAIPARRFNEAELVRRHREGVSLDAPDDEGPIPPQTPVIVDPALGRSLDFLKGMSVLQPRRS